MLVQPKRKVSLHHPYLALARLGQVDQRLELFAAGRHLAHTAGGILARNDALERGPAGSRQVQEEQRCR